eukprot:GHVR01131960.1.p1 GENE.GHVR01131960.1~~GHVR01131960.1.p1  ORF type:complete len:647 (+),score=136.26 GHVR01131960.1:62-2002(+)
MRLNLLLLTAVVATSSAYNTNDFNYIWNGEVFVLGDVHGDYDTTVSLLKQSNLIDDSLEWKCNNTLFIQLGNVIDKGPMSCELILLFDYLRNNAHVNGNRVELLMGNHEYMSPTGYYQNESYPGGDVCYGKDGKAKAFSQGGKYRHYLESLKVAIVVNGILYVHGGFNNYHSEMFKYNPAREHLRLLNLTVKLQIPTKVPDSEAFEDINNMPMFVNMIYPKNNNKNNNNWDIEEVAIDEILNVSCEVVKEILKYFSANRMVVGNSPGYGIRYHCNNNLQIHDSGISNWLYFDIIKNMYNINNINYNIIERNNNNEYRLYHDAIITNIQKNRNIQTILTVESNITYFYNNYAYNWSGEVFVLGDVHGDYDTTVSLLKQSNLIDDSLEWKCNNTLFIQLGNVIDKGPMSCELILLFDYLRNNAHVNGNRVELLMGNHEYMSPTGYYQNESYPGGDVCYGKDGKAKAFSQGGKYRHYLESLKVAIVVNDSLYAHAGIFYFESLNSPDSYKLRSLNRFTVNEYLSNLTKNTKIPTTYKDKDYSFPDLPMFSLDENSKNKETCIKVKSITGKLGVKKLRIGHFEGSGIRYICNNKLVLHDCKISNYVYYNEVKHTHGRGYMHKAIITRVADSQDFFTTFTANSFFKYFNKQ